MYPCTNDFCLSSFKICYKKQYFHQANPFHSYKLEKAKNIYEARLRLGLSQLKAHHL